MVREISQSVKKKDHDLKIRGEALFVGDYPADDVLHGVLLRSPHPKARVVSVTIPELPTGYFTVGHEDVPGENAVQIVKDDTPVFAKDLVEFVGDPILMVVGPDLDQVHRLRDAIEVKYQVLEPMLDMAQSTEVFFDYHYSKGDLDGAFAAADHVFTRGFSTGHQEQAYIETQGLEAQYVEGKITVHGSLQCPYYVHGAVAAAMGLPPDQVRIVQDVTGGGFGGKEDYPSILACQVAVAAYKAAGKAVRVIFNRREDMAYTGKRHPSITTHRVAVSQGRITAMDIDVLFDGGAYTTLSAVVLQRGIICANGVYRVPNLRVRGRAVKTNSVPNGAYRGFGAPQTFFAVERMMDYIASQLGMEPLAFKTRHMVRQGDETSTGGRYHFPVPLPAMIRKVETMSHYIDKWEQYAKPQTGRYRRGIGLSLSFHGAGFTGSGERDKIKATVGLHKTADDKVEILASNTDIGQGLKTTFSKIVARELALPYEAISIGNPDTDRVPDSGPTVASRSLMVVGELLRRAAITLRGEWKSGVEQHVEEHFREPDFVIPFSLDEFSGDAYPTYSWGVSVVELEVDSCTGTMKPLGVFSCFDVGTPMDEHIVMGQMEGGLLQGLGYASMEEISYDSKGCIRNNSFGDYLIPTALDIPNLQVALHVEEYPDGPYGAKGAGELPLVGVAAAYAGAAEQATCGAIVKIPITPQRILDALGEEKEEVLGL